MAILLKQSVTAHDGHPTFSKQNSQNVFVPSLFHPTGFGSQQTRPRLPRGETRPAVFCGADPAHDGRRGAVDDGRTDSLGRMATAVHKAAMKTTSEPIDFEIVWICLDLFVDHFGVLI